MPWRTFTIIVVPTVKRPHGRFPPSCRYISVRTVVPSSKTQGFRTTRSEWSKRTTATKTMKRMIPTTSQAAAEDDDDDETEENDS
mmetsp:Transcript_38380/g.93206  ORF Transcript_38380/g.93206 Transcript_38380/m.93206 type:complete len:85 (+) Transcript_38380:1510-1764(+)